MRAKTAVSRIQQALEEHGKALLQFSGGKDSLAVLHMCRPWADRITVVFGDTGDMFPHVVEFVRTTCASWGFPLEIVKPEVLADEYIAQCGLPVDVLPVWSHREAANYLPEDRKPLVFLQTSFECCSTLLWKPVQDFVLSRDETLVLRGSKGTDKHVSAPDGTVELCTEYVSPLWEWTDGEVFKYLRDNNVELPLQYNHGCIHSLDCAKCTAWGDTNSERQRVEFTRGFYPRIYESLRDRIIAVRDETIRQLKTIEPFLNSTED